MTYDIKIFNEIAAEGLQRFDQAHYTFNAGETPDAILLRSQKLHDYTFPESVLAVARAGAGTNNIPVERCTEQGIVVFNTPGANANAVKELVLANLLLSVRPILAGANWVNSLTGDNIEEQVEANKKTFAGNELEGKKLGVIGLGAIGSMIANDAYRLGMDVSGYDPFVSVDTAWNISRRVKRVLDLDELLADSDFITIHVPLTEKNHHLIGADELAKMKNSAVLLNFARGELVDSQAVIRAIDSGQLKSYITDFAEPDLLRHDKIIVLPHLGASTSEAETNCAKMAASTLKTYLETGNIKCSVNFPAVEMVFRVPYRIAIINRNVPNLIGAVTSTVAEKGYNIDNLSNRSRGDFAYTLLDINDLTAEQAQSLVEDIRQLDNVVRVRAIKHPTLEEA